MPNNMNSTEKYYEWLTKINELDFQNKSVLLIGGGEISNQYLDALLKLKITNITILTKTGKTIKNISNKIKIITGGFEKSKYNKKHDLVIIATPIPLLLDATEFALKIGNNNILIEKPGSLYYKKINLLSKKFKTKRIRIAYNRISYPNFYKLKSLVKKEGGITSCRFTFTEWLNRIDFDKYQKDEYALWGISNSLHVITMAMELIGMPKKLSAYNNGFLKWHKTGKIFIGSGISEKDIPFTYHADWGSGGRWGIEIMTKENLYQLIPLEDLFVIPKYSIKKNQIKFRSSFSSIKPGIAEEIALMLNPNMEKKIPLMTLEKSVQYNKIAEKIFGYKT